MGILDKLKSSAKQKVETHKELRQIKKEAYEKEKVKVKSLKASKAKERAAEKGRNKAHRRENLVKSISDIGKKIDKKLQENAKKDRSGRPNPFGFDYAPAQENNTTKRKKGSRKRGSTKERQDPFPGWP